MAAAYSAAINDVAAGATTMGGRAKKSDAEEPCIETPTIGPDNAGLLNLFRRAEVCPDEIPAIFSRNRVGAPEHRWA